jgi:sugar-specific transcriptional regulator TrmB
MQNDELLNRLITLGLTTYESKGYIALLQKQALTAAELAKLSGIPRTRIYDVLEGLAQEGLCVELLGKGKKFQAVAPEICIQKLLEHQKADLISKEKMAQNLVVVLADLYQRGSVNKDPLDYIELLRDPQQVGLKVMQLVSNAESEILVFVKPPFSNPKGELEKQNDESIRAATRKIVCKAIYEIPKGDEEKAWMLKQIERSVSAGEQARVTNFLPLKMAIVDEFKVVFAMEDYHQMGNRQTSLLIEHRALATGLKMLFDTLWDKARDFHEMQEPAETAHTQGP